MPTAHSPVVANIVPDTSPADRMAVCLRLGVENRFHAAVVQGVRLREVHDGEAVLHVSSHVLIYVRSLC